MRIIAGKARGRKLFTPADNRVRPTADRVKEALFNIIGPRIVEADVLDLFCGTGNLGLEAWSRGARSVALVDCHKDSMRLAERNRNLIGATEVALMRGDVLQVLSHLGRQKQSFDWVLCDPPYRQGWIARLLASDALLAVLREAGVLVFEHDRREAAELLQAAGKRWRVMRQAAYGDTVVSFLTRHDESEQCKEDAECEK